MEEDIEPPGAAETLHCSCLRRTELQLLICELDGLRIENPRLKANCGASLGILGLMSWNTFPKTPRRLIKHEEWWPQRVSG